MNIDRERLMEENISLKNQLNKINAFRNNKSQKRN